MAATVSPWEKREKAKRYGGDVELLNLGGNMSARLFEIFICSCNKGPLGGGGKEGDRKDMNSEMQMEGGVLAIADLEGTEEY